MQDHEDNSIRRLIEPGPGRKYYECVSTYEIYLPQMSLMRILNEAKLFDREIPDDARLSFGVEDHEAALTISIVQDCQFDPTKSTTN